MGHTTIRFSYGGDALQFHHDAHANSDDVSNNDSDNGAITFDAGRDHTDDSLLNFGNYDSYPTNASPEQVSVCIIIPTYNEAHNIIDLLMQIYSEAQQIRYEEEKITMNVLVVDDNSPDGTAKAVAAYQKRNSHIFLLQRDKKNGLGEAYIAGMHHAMNMLDPGIIFEMDADLSHGPEYILPMIGEIREGADFVIGSRYVPGGSIPSNWGAKRRMISKCANFYAKTLLGIKDINDCTGGFRAMRTSALKIIDLGSLGTKGYAFQISLLEEMRRNGANMKEVPIAFKDRTNGSSKMGIYDMLEEGYFILKTSVGNLFYRKNNQVRGAQGAAYPLCPPFNNSFNKSSTKEPSRSGQSRINPAYWGKESTFDEEAVS